MAATTAMGAPSGARLIIGAHRFSSRTLIRSRNSFAPKRRSLSSLSNRPIVTCTVVCNPEVSVREEGQPKTLDYRVSSLESSGGKISTWHDIPLQLGDGAFNFVVEIQKETSAKVEVARDEPYTPIKQDTKNGKLRYYPYNINWNYGLLLQTGEDQSFANIEVEGAFGDNDPVDVVEILDARVNKGDALKVNPLEALAMIDEGELDWKIVAMSLDDPRAPLMNDANNVENRFPGTLTAARDCFRDYKIQDGKLANKFGLGNKAADKKPKLLKDDRMALPVKASSEAAEVTAQAPEAAPEAAQAEGKARPKSSGKKRRSKNSRNNETSTRNIEDPYQILRHPVTTEASLKELEANNTLTFVVDKRADKKMIRAAVEKLYDIRTRKVNTLMRPDGSKKAYVMCESNVAKKIGLFSSQ